MALTGSITKRRDIPHEDGEWMEFRQLDWTQLQLAREERVLRGLDRARAMRERVGKEHFAEMQAAAKAPTDASLDDQYDRATLLNLGIVSWSYDAPVAPDTINQLDEPTAVWAMGCILGIHAMAGAAAEVARGNGISGYSTS